MFTADAREDLRDDVSIVDMIPALRAFARRFYRNTTDADDLVQDTLVKALDNFDSFEPGTRLKSWLFKIMRNTFYTKFKVYSREAPGAQDCVATRPFREASQEWSVRGREVAAAMDRISPSYREALVLVGMLGVSYEETAAISDCAVGTVKSRLSRGRARLLEELGEASPRSLVETGRRITSGGFEADRPSQR